MAAVTRTHDGRLVLEGTTWSLVQRRMGQPFLDLLDDAGGRWAVLAAIGAVDTLEGPDEWWAVDEPVVTPADGAPGRRDRDLEGPLGALGRLPVRPVRRR